MPKSKNTKTRQKLSQFLGKKNIQIRQKLSDFAIQISHKLSDNKGSLILQDDQNLGNINIKGESEGESQKIESELILQKTNSQEKTNLQIISEENKELIAKSLEELKTVSEEKTLKIKENLTKIANEKMVIVNQKIREFMIKMTQDIKKLSKNTLELKEKFEKSEIHSFDYSKFVTENNFILVSKTIVSWIFPISVWVRTVGILVTLAITFLSWSEGRNQINLLGLLSIFVLTFGLIFVLSRTFLTKWKDSFENKDFKIRFFTTFGILFLLSLQFWPVVASVLFTFAFQSSFLVFTTTILAASLTIFGHYFLLGIIPKKEILGNLLLIGGFLTWYAIFRFSFGGVFPDFVNIIYIFVIANTFSQINAIDLLKLNLQTIGLSLAIYLTTTKFPSGVELMVLGFICALGVMIRVALDFWQILIKTFRKNEELLHNTLPQSIAKRLQNETLIADSFESASVLFCDIVGYTTYSSGKNPEEVVKTLNFIFSQFDELCEELGLEKIKTIGDAYMVAGGLMGNWENHAYKIAQMGLGIRQIIRNLNRDFGLNMRIGIHSGKVVAGVIGLKKFTYDIWGDTVNVASRMESHSLPGQIQISKATWELIKDDFEFSKPNTVAIKGKGEMTTYFLINQKTQVDQTKPTFISIKNVKNQNKDINSKKEGEETKKIEKDLQNSHNNNPKDQTNIQDQNIRQISEINQTLDKNITIKNAEKINKSTNSTEEIDSDIDWNEVLEKNYENSQMISQTINQDTNRNESKIEKEIVEQVINKIINETIGNSQNEANYQTRNKANYGKKTKPNSQIIKIIPNKKLPNINKLAAN